MIVGFTGTARGMSTRQKEQLTELLVSLKATSLHHGDCVGADRQADEICVSLNIPRVIHPPIDSSKRAFCKGEIILQEKPYLVRNHAIVDSCDVMIATPKDTEETLRSGTWATIRYAMKVGRHLHVLSP